MSDKIFVKQYNFSGMKLLVADADAFISELVDDMFRIVRGTVDCAANGRQAVDMFERASDGTYALILLDTRMPGMNGYEAAGAIRRSRHPEGRTVPIYAMRENVGPESMEEALNAGMNGQLAKPLDINTLYRIVEAARNRRGKK
ncbi:MAG: response regulator [Lachnospiraceae bacterium]|nr:response regulator [Lachnospiraceae bacterium]